jgi:hypothetical protein
VPAHIRIRILLLLAVAVICGSVFAVSDVQRRSDATSFEQYSRVRELRGATADMALVFGEAATHGATVSAAVETTTRALLRALDRVRSTARSPRERGLLEQQASAARPLLAVWLVAPVVRRAPCSA